MLNIITNIFYTVIDLKLSQVYFLFKYKIFGFRNVKYNFKKLSIKKKINKVSFLSTNNIFINKNKVFNLNKYDLIENFNLKTSNKLQRYNFFYLRFILNKKEIKNKYKTTKLIINYLDSSINRKIIDFWDPYVSSLRLINLIKFISITKIDNAKLNSYLFHHFKVIKKNLEFRLGANHLLTNLIAIKCFETIYNKDDQKFDLFNELFVKALKEQINNYGEHYELSPMYQSIILEQLIDLIIICKAYNKKVDKNLFEIVSKMFDCLCGVHHKNGQIAFFNDTNNSSVSIQSLKKLYNSNFSQSIKANITKNYESSNFKKRIFNKICFLIKIAGPGPKFNPGHSHADTLSFEISFKNEKLFVNKGISSYNVNKLRLFQRSTRSHNCFEIDKKNSSEVWSSFRMARKARSFSKFIGKKKLILGHDGYSNFFFKRIVYRKVYFSSNKIKIIDSIDGKFNIARQYFHFYPGLKPIIKNNKLYIFKKKRTICVIESNVDNIKFKKGFFYEDFNKKEKNYTIVMSSKKSAIETDILFVK